MSYNPVSWRSKVYDRIGRSVFGEPTSTDFYFIEGDRVFERTHASFKRCVRDNLLRRDLRALLSRRAMFVAMALLVACCLNAGSYTSALAHAIH